MAITWTKLWSGADDGTVLRAIDLRNIQLDLSGVLQASDIGTLIQAWDEDLDALSTPENLSSANLIDNGDFSSFDVPPTPESWIVEGGGVEAQETANVQLGSNSYSITSDADGSASRQNIIAVVSGSENTYFRGRTITLTARVYATDVSNARIQLDDGVGVYSSEYHTGTAGWETLSVTATLSATASKLDAILAVDGNVLTGLFDMVRANYGEISWEYQETGLELLIAGQTLGDMLYFNGSDWVRLPAGTTGQVLTSAGVAAPDWETRFPTDTLLQSATFSAVTIATITETLVSGRIYKAVWEGTASGDDFNAPEILINGDTGQFYGSLTSGTTSISAVPLDWNYASTNDQPLKVLGGAITDSNQINFVNTGNFYLEMIITQRNSQTQLKWEWMNTAEGGGSKNVYIARGVGIYTVGLVTSIAFRRGTGTSNITGRYYLQEMNTA